MTTATPADSTKSATLPQEAIRTVLKEVFSALNGEKISYLNKLSSDKDGRQKNKTHILALMGTGLYSKEELIQLMEKIPASTEKVMQVEILNAWLTSEARPEKEVCLQLMNSFAEKDGHLVAEILLSRSEDFSMQAIAKMLIDGVTPLTEACYTALASEVARFKNRAAR